MHSRLIRAAGLLVAVLGLWAAGCNSKSATSNTGTGGSGMPGGSGGDNGGTGGGPGGESGSGGGPGMAGAPGTNPGSETPVIRSFVADPTTLPAGGGMATLKWTVDKADSLTIDKGVGTVTGNMATVNVTATTIYTLTATNAKGSASATTAVSVGANPSSAGTRFVAMVSPTNGETFVAPATLRFLAAGRDPNIDTNQPSSGLGGNAAQVQFFVDDQLMLTVDGAHAEFWMFKGFGGMVPAGAHRVWARATYTKPDLVLDSPPALITVKDPPAYGKTVDLDADVMMDAAGYSLVGTAQSRVRLNGHGHKLGSASGASGPLTLQFVDVFDLGSATDGSMPGIDVSTTGAVVIEDSTFQSTNPVHVSVGGTASASVRRNLFSSNMRTPIGQLPGSPTTYSGVYFTGGSTGTKVFAGNNIAASWVEFDRTTGWMVGGNTDADSNVIIGARAGIYTPGSTNITVRRNYSHHVYYGGWSQGSNLEIESTTNAVFEHNVIFGSSWPIRGGGKACELRFNLIMEAGHEWMQPGPGTLLHHNLWVGGDEDEGGLFIYLSSAQPNADRLMVTNNTFDGLNGTGIRAAVRMGPIAGPVTLSSNAFLNYPKAAVVLLEGGGTLTADYNGFFGPAPGYSDGRMPGHDVKGTDAKLSDPPTKIFDLEETAIWNRSTTTAAVLGIYRNRYKPAAGSPLLGAGDPALASGNWLGAIGDGQAASDGFGRP